MAVLYRNNLSAIPIVDRLNRAGIPFRLPEGNLFFFSNWVVLDVLEFDTVFMADLTQQEIPGENVAARPVEEKETLEEERRLYYVGMTRARCNLYLLFPAMLRDVSQQPSIFMEETARCMKPEQESSAVKHAESFEHLATVDQVSAGMSVSVGQTVQYKLFGKGTVTEVKQSNGCLTVFINFEGKDRILDWNICAQSNLVKIL